MDAALQSFTHAAAHRELKWDSSRAGWIKDYVKHIADSKRRALLEKFLALYEVDRKSTRLNSSHSQISYAVFCLKKKTKRAKRLYNLEAIVISIGSPTPFTCCIAIPSYAFRYVASYSLSTATHLSTGHFIWS